LSTPFQNRLVGTIIIAALAVIVLPDILDGDKKTYQEEFEPIPAIPPTDFSTKAVDFPDEKLEQLPSKKFADDTAIDDQQTFLKDKPLGDNTDIKKEVADNKKTLTLDTNKQVKVRSVKKEADFTQLNKVSNKTAEKIKAPVIALPERAVAEQAWVIQLGSFRHKNNVKELVEKLKNNGYTVFTKPIITKNGTLTKVFVGPELIKSSLQKKLISLNKLTNVKGKIAGFKPTKK
jgi:DedD protein